MFTSGFLWAVQQFAVPACSILASVLISKYFSSTGREGTGTLINSTTVLMLVLFWLFPRLDNLGWHTLNLGGDSGNIVGSWHPNYTHGFSIPDVDMSYHSHTLLNEIGGWVATQWRENFHVAWEMISK